MLIKKYFSEIIKFFHFRPYYIMRGQIMRNRICASLVRVKTMTKAQYEILSYLAVLLFIVGVVLNRNR